MTQQGELILSPQGHGPVSTQIVAPFVATTEEYQLKVHSTTWVHRQSHKRFIEDNCIAHMTYTMEGLGMQKYSRVWR